MIPTLAPGLVSSVTYISSKYLGSIMVSAMGLGSPPWQVAVSPNGMTLAVIMETTNVLLIDTGSNVVLHTVAGLTHAPLNTDDVMSFTPDGTVLYVVDGGANKVHKIVVATGAITSITVGTSPQGLAISTDGFVYVANKTSHDITKINVITDATSSIPIGSPLSGSIAITPDNSLVFAGLLSSHLVVRLDTATNATSTIDFGNHQAGIAITSDGKSLWVVTTTSFRSYTIETSILNGAIAHGLASSSGCYINSTNSYVLTSGFASNKVAILTVSSGIVSLVNTGADPNQIAISPDGTRACVACDTNNLSQINLSTNAVTTIGAANGPSYLAYGRTGRLLYLESYNNNSLTIVDCLSVAA